ncbi:MAG: RNAPII degradation factor [Icmadophila ericetorum]|nr:RNAPII degradation factor [Icmadophila ericetorum]
MSEVQTRPSGPRGRGSARGGRGGYSSRGGRAGYRHTNGEKPNVEPEPTYEDDSEIGQLKKQYGSKVNTVQEMFPEWTDEDVVFALEETNGDLASTIERISEGTISRWGEVKKKNKDRARSKVKEPTAASGDGITASARGGRGRGGFEGARGGRGRDTERGRGAGRGFRGRGGLSGSKPQAMDKSAMDSGPDPMANTTTSDSTSAWETPGLSQEAIESTWDQQIPPSAASPDASSWEMVMPTEDAPPPLVEPQPRSSKPDGTRSWASIFNKPTPPPTRPKVEPAPAIQERVPEPPLEPEQEPINTEKSGLPPPIPTEESVPDRPSTPPPSELNIEITPSKDELTETNVGQVLDTSAPPPTATAASTVATTHDPRSATASVAPSQAPQPYQSPARPALSGFATSAYKATGSSGRSSSFQRRVLEQQEAVVMPSNHAVDRAAVQFGSMGLNSPSDDLDVDDEREEAETRTQPPQHSPVAPRATLPPVPQQPSIDPIPIPTPRQAPGLPPAPQQPYTHQSSQTPIVDPAKSAQSSQNAYSYNQFNNRYGPSATQQETPAPTQKAYEPFGQQIHQQQSQSQPYDSYPSQSQVASQPQQQTPQSQAGSYSAAPDYSAYYPSDAHRTSNYPNYYDYNGRPTQQNQQDNSVSQQRSGSAFGSTGPEQTPQYATSQAQPPAPSRYGQPPEAQTSGHSTPNPMLAVQPAQSQSQPSHHINQHQTGGQHGAYQYGNPYYNSPYYQQPYSNQVSHHHSYGRERPMFDDVRRYDDQFLTHNHQFGYGASQGGYGSGPFTSNKGMYGQPHQGYGMSPQAAYDHHSASPANVGGYGQGQSISGRDVPLGGGTLGGYGRSGSTQPSDSQQQHTSSAGTFGSMPDAYGRPQSGFTGQAQNSTQSQSTNEEANRGGYGDVSKVPGGPSPAAGQPGARPGSAANNLQGQAGVLPSQSQSQQAYGVYPNQMNHQVHGQQASQYGAGLGGLAGHPQSNAQNHQGGSYGAGYSTGFGGSYYGNQNTRGGWGGNYTH